MKYQISEVIKEDLNESIKSNTARNNTPPKNKNITSNKLEVLEIDDEEIINKLDNKIVKSDLRGKL
jgi:hypothetical protein